MTEFVLLDSPALRDAEGVAVDLGPAKQRTVLAALLVDAGRWVTVETLIDRVWGEGPPLHVRPSLYAYITRIRQSLARAAVPGGTGAGDGSGRRQLRHGPGGYLIDVPHDRVDVHRFRRLIREARATGRADAERATLLREALGLWRGEPLAGLAGEWAERTRSGWRQQRIEAVLALAEAEFRVGGHVRVIGELTGLVQEQPLVEPLTVALMRALQAAGRGPEALTCYDVLRRRLAEELGTLPGPEAQRAHQAILRGESGPPPAIGPAPPEREHGRTVPAQLPLSTRGFTGRQAELARLDGALADAAERPAAVVVSVVSGTAGVGKTTLAVHWAHRVAEHFPGGQLYVNLRGFDPSGTAMTPDEAVLGFLDALGVPAQRVPAASHARVGLYRSLLAGRRALVVLDNAHDTEQVRPLLPGSPGSVAVVTSRNRLAGLLTSEGARPVLLDLLSPAEARTLLARRLGEHRVAAEPEAVAEIITSCTRLPLALAIATARAAGRPHFPLRVVAEELRDSHGTLDAFAGDDLATDARAVFSWSLRGLSAPASRLFHLLGLHFGPDISAPAAAALAGLPLQGTRGPLAELTRAHLLTEHVPGRYALHDLLRVYATERALARRTPAERDTAVHRLLTWYLYTADATHSLLTPHRRRAPLAPAPAACEPLAFRTHREAREWCEAERANLVTAVHRAVATGRADVAWRLTTALWGFFYLSGHLHDWLDTTRASLDGTRDSHDRVGEAWSLNDLACALRQMHRYDEAIERFRQAMALNRELGFPYGRRQDLVNLGYTHRLAGRPDDAITYYRRALAVGQAPGDPSDEGSILANLGDAYLQLARYDDAIGCLERALVLLRATGDEWAEGIALDILGTVHRRLGRLDDAFAHYDRALARHADVGNRWGQAHTLSNLGDTHLALGAPATARTHWERALSILEEVNHPDADTVRERLRLPGAC
ncbi:BTAD domain-containing putative transcriptional regulator [Streptomyces sp. NPDC004539]|uniref:AfsR/SARP family transcriptional regulator n=1 Tax=Streptomyces sp. NPDC004539 TaxID=3154280 RepID=UPI0033AA816C